MQFNFDNNSSYLNDLKFLKLEDKDNNSYKGGNNESSKPKENIPTTDQSNVSKADSIQEINIGYPIDANEFKKLKKKSTKNKKNDIDDNIIEHDNISQEDKN